MDIESMTGIQLTLTIDEINKILESLSNMRFWPTISIFIAQRNCCVNWRCIDR